MEVELSVDQDELKALEPLGNAPLIPAHAVASLALNMALKYHDINHVHDGMLYQQYKLEGRNIEPLHLEWVFHTARQIEHHIMTSPNRLSDAIFEQLAAGLEEELAAEEAEGTEAATPASE